MANRDHPDYGFIVDYSNGKQDEVNITEKAQDILCKYGGLFVFCELCYLMMSRQNDKFEMLKGSKSDDYIDGGRCLDCIDV